MEVQEMLLQQNEKASLPTCASPCGDWIVIERNGAANNGSNGGEGISYSRKFAVIIVALWPSQHLSHPRRGPGGGANKDQSRCDVCSHQSVCTILRTGVVSENVLRMTSLFNFLTPMTFLVTCVASRCVDVANI
jgi:hypothetical protein